MRHQRIRSFKAHVLHPGRNSIFEHKLMKPTLKGDELFIKSNDDEKICLSVEDREFINIMDGQVDKDNQRNWIVPLPFRANRQKQPNNRYLALKRAKIVNANLRMNSVKEERFVTCMQKVLD